VSAADSPPETDGVARSDLDAMAAQLGRAPRGAREVSHRCPCGQPDVVETAPRLPDGTPFPTFYYLTHPAATAAMSALEATQVMNEYNDLLASDDDVREQYRAAHEQYLADRESVGVVAELDGVSAGGMPTRVKCLHALAAHALAAGPDVNPIGDRAVAEMGEWWAAGPCAQDREDEAG